MRGNRRNSCSVGRLHRSIPACAGEPNASESVSPSSSVYPRVCGGTERVGVCIAVIVGLSPRVRGNRTRRSLYRRHRRSIPACAGEPVNLLSVAAPLWVYPRVCGGTVIGAGQVSDIMGLSPRVRGNLCRDGANNARARSIPACAGGTSRVDLLYRCQKGLSPRVRGTRVICGQTAKMMGLSPRVRGNHLCVAHE